MSLRLLSHPLLWLFLPVVPACAVTPTDRPRTLLELAGAAPAPARWSNSVLVLIDVQQDYAAGGRLALPDGATTWREIRHLLDRARAAGTPVVHVQQLSPPGRGAFETGSPGAGFIAEATPHAGETIVTKRLPNSFAGTTLEETLRRLGRKELIIAGAMTHMCVSSTARAALDHGYHVTIIAAACATRDLPALDGTVIPAATVHRVALAELADRFATVVTKAADIQE